MCVFVCVCMCSCVCVCILDLQFLKNWGIWVKMVPNHLLIGQFQMSQYCHPNSLWGMEKVVRSVTDLALKSRKSEEKLLLQSWLLQNCKQTEVLQSIYLPFEEERNLQEKYTSVIYLLLRHLQNLFENVCINWFILWHPFPKPYITQKPKWQRSSFQSTEKVSLSLRFPILFTLPSSSF